MLYVHLDIYSKRNLSRLADVFEMTKEDNWSSKTKFRIREIRSDRSGEAVCVCRYETAGKTKVNVMTVRYKYGLGNCDTANGGAQLYGNGINYTPLEKYTCIAFAAAGLFFSWLKKSI